MDEVQTLQLPDGRSLAWTETGDPAGQPCFFFHGLPGSRLGAAAIAQASTMRVICTDRPGFGRSSPVVGERRLLDWPDDVRALADHLGLERFLVAGVSGGGCHSLACAVALPERVVAAGVICGAGPIDDEAGMEGMHEQNRALFALALTDPAQLETVFAAMAEQLSAAGDDAARAAMEAQLPPADRAVIAEHPELTELLTEDAKEALRQGVGGTVAEIVMDARPWGFDLAAIRVPVLLWQGTEDANAPVAHGRRMAAEIPDCTATFYQGEGHLMFVGHWGEIDAALTAAWDRAVADAVPERSSTAEPVPR